MEHLTRACLQLLRQLESAVEAVSREDFCKPSTVLGGSSIGQHLRHTLEFFLCLEKGMARGTVNYDQRAHDRGLEADRDLAIEVLGAVRRFVESSEEDRSLVLEVCYHPRAENHHSILTTYSRELAYNIEHAVHHMAIMKIGIRDVAGHVSLPASFGVAESTIRYQKELAANKSTCAIS